VDLVDDEVVASVHRLAEQVIHEAHAQAGQRQQPNHPRVGLAPGRGMIEGDEEEGGGAAGQDGNNAGDEKPLAHVGQQLKLF